MSSGGPRARDLRALLERDHGIAELLARAIARDADPKDAVLDAWRSVLSEVADGEELPTRERVLAAVVDALHSADLIDLDDGGDPPAVGTLQPPEHRWAGWWDDDDYPLAWPPDSGLDGAQLLRAVRRLPLRLRVLVVLREAGGLDGEAVARILGGTPSSHAVELDAARLGLVKYVGDEVLGTGEPAR